MGKSDDSSTEERDSGNISQWEAPQKPTLRLPTVDWTNSSSNVSSRWEIWTVRLPSGASLQDLDGGAIDLMGARTTPIVSSNGSSYTLQEGSQFENAGFRVLLPTNTRDDDDSGSSSDSESRDSDSPKQYFEPYHVPFTRHLNLVTYVPTESEIDLAPSSERAPASQDSLRRPYTKVPQRSGLKQRWMPLGGTFAVKSPGDGRSQRNVTGQETPASDHKHLNELPKPRDEPSGEQEPGEATAAPFAGKGEPSEDHEMSAKSASKKAKKEAKRARKEDKRREKKRKK